ncbi:MULTISPECIES: hypothetical protein [Symbiopectobacterium]|uniref:hypothetical protein n=1 Tax=Symbiopectobacterium TaxID=801 RepID=UPI001A23CC13|nr:hypothetical protein [Candidatus Symbiopectobacterium sp. PLON1]MBT9428275.1 hypothetical protein [Candidatus Symbiopectobacterium endolongispinus]
MSAISSFRILYHPVAYAHPSHLPEAWRTKERASEPLLNYWLYRRYQLTAPLKPGMQHIRRRQS